jgi:hypothetical protein
MKLKDVFREVLPLIQRVAPSVAAAIGGPIGMAADYIFPVLADAFGVSTSEPKAVVDAILSHDGSENTLAKVEADHCDVLCGLMNSVNQLSQAEINIKLSWK